MLSARVAIERVLNGGRGGLSLAMGLCHPVP